MRIALTTFAIFFGIVAHAAHLAPWDIDGDGMRAGTVESAFGASTAETGVGIAAGVAVGLVPVYGQMADARDTAANIKNVWDNPGSGEAWAGLAMSGVAWIPGAGDAAKGAYKGGRRVASVVDEAVTKKLDHVEHVARKKPGPVFGTTKEAAAAAKANGWRRTNMRTPNNQVIFTDGRNFYSRDADGHIGGAWKLMDPRNPIERIGTLDVDLRMIGE